MPVSAKTFNGTSTSKKKFARKFHQLQEIKPIKTAQFFVAHALRYVCINDCI